MRRHVRCGIKVKNIMGSVERFISREVTYINDCQGVATSLSVPVLSQSQVICVDPKVPKLGTNSQLIELLSHNIPQTVRTMSHDRPSMPIAIARKVTMSDLLEVTVYFTVGDSIYLFRPRDGPGHCRLRRSTSSNSHPLLYRLGPYRWPADLVVN